MQDGRYIYFFQTERVGSHQNGTTVFRLIEIDLEKKNKCQLIKEYSFEDDKGKDGDWLAVRIEFLENHTEKHYVKTLQRESKEEFPSFLLDQFVYIKFAKFYAGELMNQSHLNSPVKIRLCSIKNLETCVQANHVVYMGLIKEKITLTLINHDDLRYLQRSAKSSSNLSDTMADGE